MKLVFKSYSFHSIQVLIPSWEWFSLEESLMQHMQLSPQNFYLDKPLVARLEMPEKPNLESLKRLKDLFQKYGILLMGIIHPLLDAAEVYSCQLCLLKDDTKASTLHLTRSEAVPHHQIIRRPIRSGEIIHSMGDLTIIGNTHSGSDLVAHGHIYVLGKLKGRAFAGVRGQKSSMIYAQEMDAELLSIAGYYQSKEYIHPQAHALVTLSEDHSLLVETLQNQMISKIRRIS